MEYRKLFIDILVDISNLIRFSDLLQKQNISAWTFSFAKKLVFQIEKTFLYCVFVIIREIRILLLWFPSTLINQFPLHTCLFWSNKEQLICELRPTGPGYRAATPNNWFHCWII